MENWPDTEYVSDLSAVCHPSGNQLVRQAVSAYSI